MGGPDDLFEIIAAVVVAAFLRALGGDLLPALWAAPVSSALPGHRILGNCKKRT
ncbi:MAG: hypothetical protein ACFBRM_01465 [Pikeienuella sp.]